MDYNSLHAVAPKLPTGLLYGGDYNPEQWSPEIWREDVKLMKTAGVNFVSLAIFSWAKLEPRPGEYRFDWLDEVIDLLWSERISVNLATATASPPPWFSLAHPESLPVDEAGTRLSIGSRQHYCPNSTAYRAASTRLCRRMAQRYAAHDAVALWHINNEIGCHNHSCYCDVCAVQFRSWLRQRYETIEALNQGWGTTFWSQAYGAWEEIMPPRKTLTFRNPGQVIDYAAFMSDSLHEVLRAEICAVREVAPDAKVTTNGLGFWKQTDYQAWYRDVDVAAWDAYPDPVNGLTDVRWNAFSHDLFRSLRGGQPFILMEQTPSQVNWRSANALKAPGQMRALSYQAVARGADGVMFFQWRASAAGAEKFHGAMVPHYGPHGRVFAEVAALGRELSGLGEVAGARTKSRVAMLVSWRNRWALEIESKPLRFDYPLILSEFYRAFWDLNIAIDVIHPDAPKEGYDVIVAPALYQLSECQSSSLRQFVRAGGTLLMSYFSGVADEHERIGCGGYPALLQDVLGIAVEEWQPLDEAAVPTLVRHDNGMEHLGFRIAESVHLRGAEAQATFASGIFSGKPAITHHGFGRGAAIYVATQPDVDGLRNLVSRLLVQRGITAPLRASAGVEVCARQHASGEYLFVVNHTPTAQTVTLGEERLINLLSGDACSGEHVLEPFAVRVFRRPRANQNRLAVDTLKANPIAHERDPHHE